MQNTKSHSPNAGVKVVAGLLVASQVTAIAEEASTPATSPEVVETLEPTTVIATKFEKELKDVSASVAVLDVADLQEEGKISVQDAIGYRTPGVIATSTAGQRGQSGSLFIRGTTTKYSQMRLDGVRVSDSSSLYNNFLGSSSLFGYSSIDILKGASSSFYGGGAIGGVVSLTTAKGEGEPTHSATAEYGSYNSWLGNLSSQGQIGDFSYNIGVTAEDTQNDSDSPVSGNDFSQMSYYSRFDYAIDDRSSIGMTLRVGDSYSETPERGNPVTNTTQKNHYDNVYGTLFYTNQVTDEWNTKFTFGYSKEDFDSRGYGAEYDLVTYLPTGGYVNNDFDSNTDRYSFYWDNEYVWTEDHATVVGTYFENSKYESSYQDSTGRDTYGIYLNHAWRVIDPVLLNGTIGWDDHDDFGDEVTWNAGALYNVTDTTNLKANAGTGFRAPSFGELGYNKNLEAEKSFNWDLVVEQQICNTNLSVTWFENDIDNLIEADGYDPVTFEAFYSNSERKTKANGLEFAADADIEQINSTLYASYTYYQRVLDAIIPQQTAAAGIKTDITDDLNAGLSATWVDRRESSDPGVDTLESYFLVDLYTNYQVNENVKLHARIENLLDDNYLLGDYSGFFGDLNAVKGRGRGIYGGVTVTF